MTGFQEKSKILCDQNGVHHTRAEECTILGSREEVALCFGTPVAADRGHVRYRKRIVLNPFAAKQFSAALNRVIADYEARFGALVAQPPAPFHDPEARRHKAASVFQLVKTLGVSIGYERSFKIQERTLLPDRFLLGINKKEIDTKAQDRIVHVCRQMGMPSNLLDPFSRSLFDANYVHFGFEDDGGSCIYKVYLEFLDRIQQDLTSTNRTDGPQLLHLGFKWDPFETRRQAVTHYNWHPWITGAQIIDRVTAIADPGRHPHLFETASALIGIAAARMPHQDILYLEVTEAGNPRRSFDINLYRGGLQVGELYPLLARLGQHYAVAYPPFRELYSQIRNRRFGHLAGGISRQGKDFCTVYYGAAALEEKGPAQALAFDADRPRHPEVFCPVEQTDEQAGILLQQVQGLDVPVGLERSFKVARASFLADRFLVGFERQKAPPQRVFEICRRIGMPADFSARFQEAYKKANIVLFGFEKNETNRLYKAYLEFNANLKRALDADPAHPAPCEIFIGFKWDAADPSRRVITRYTCYPAYDLRDMARRAAQFLSRGGHREPALILDGILDLAAHRAGPGEFLYFEADESGTARRSFSINLYRAGLRVAEIYPLLLEMARFYTVSPKALHRVYQEAKSQILGHLAGGVDRQGGDFLTFYYAQKGSSRPAGDLTKGNDGLL